MFSVGFCAAALLLLTSVLYLHSLGVTGLSATALMVKVNSYNRTPQ